MPKQKGQTAQRPKKQVKSRKQVRGLDVEARSYARLLNDPCYSAIVRPVYSSSGSGNFVRVETDFILGAEASSIGAACLFTPGLMSPMGGIVSGVVTPTTVVSGDTAAIVWNNNLGLQPGVGMVNMFGSTRAVAACLQISFVGSENARSGVVSMTQTTRDAAVATTSLAQMRSVSTRIVRMPDGVLEVKLSPTAANQNFLPCNAATTALGNEHPTLAVSVSGIPSSTGVRFRLVQVLEWLPAGGAGIMTNSDVSSSKNTLTSVISAMQAANPSWQYDLLVGLGAYAAKTIAWL